MKKTKVEQKNSNDEMMIDLQKKFQERVNELIDVLELQKDWKLTQLSDGQRRRVQIFLKLINKTSCTITFVSVITCLCITPIIKTCFIYNIYHPI